MEVEAQFDREHLKKAYSFSLRVTGIVSLVMAIVPLVFLVCFSPSGVMCTITPWIYLPLLVPMVFGKIMVKEGKPGYAPLAMIIWTFVIMFVAAYYIFMIMLGILSWSGKLSVYSYIMAASAVFLYLSPYMIYNLTLFYKMGLGEPFRLMAVGSVIIIAAACGLGILFSLFV